MASQTYTNQREIAKNFRIFDINVIAATGKKLVKRVFDFTFALVGLILLLPVFLYISILIRQDSPGPVFFWGSRMGKGGKPFKMLKFRTMYERQESYQGPRVTADGDDRITPLGHWLRDTKINELPQLWNVLKGEMSFVGPRPEDVEIAKSWPQDAFDEILSIRPGITSPTSILYHDEEKLLSKENLMLDYFKSILPEKIRLDRLYVRHHSFFSDLDVIFWTIAIILPQLAETRIPEGYLFAGPISRLVNRYVNWFLVDFLVSIIVTYLASFIWPIEQPTRLYLSAIALVMALMFSACNSFVGLNRVLWPEATMDDAIRLTGSVVFTTIMISTTNYLKFPYYLLETTPLPTNMILFIGITAGFGFLAARYRLRLISSGARRWVNWRHNASQVGERVLMVGAGDAAKIANYLLRQHTFRTAFSVVGTIDNNNPSKHGMRVGGHWILGGLKDIPSIIKKYDVGLILSTVPHQDPENEHILEICRTSHIKLIFLDDLLSMTDRQMTRPRGQVDNPIWMDGHLEYKAMHDTTTGLPNRYLFQDRIKYTFAHAKRNKTQPGLIFMEFDQIRKISDTLGNNISNQVVIDLAKRLISCKRESDTLARFGFDKFALLLEHVPSEREAEVVIQRLQEVLSDPFDVHGQEVYINSKIGHCLCNQTCGAFENSNRIEVTRFYGCVMSKVKEKTN
jgi:diguanylate cyclase (GGDEF)-like protein